MFFDDFNSHHMVKLTFLSLASERFKNEIFMGFTCLSLITRSKNHTNLHGDFQHAG